MIYTRTYEDFINGLVEPSHTPFTNLFRKRKKLPDEVKLLAFYLTKFIKNHIRKDWDIYCRTQQSIDKKNDDIIYISINPNDLGGSPNFINLYYNSNTKMLMLAIIPQPRVPELVDIQNFVEHIISNYEEDRRDYLTTMKEGTRFWIKLDKIKKVTDEINNEAFDLFTNANKYNL